jgi:hypothetical protein
MVLLLRGCELRGAIATSHDPFVDKHEERGQGDESEHHEFEKKTFKPERSHALPHSQIKIELADSPSQRLARDPLTPARQHAH